MQPPSSCDLPALSGSPGHRQPFSAPPGKRTALKQRSPALKGREINPGFLCRKGRIVFVFQIHAAFGISRLSGFKGCWQTGSLEYFDLFGHRADLQPAVLAAVFVF